ncbi:MICOS complex subunit MIC60 [Pontixanthobacter aquaemixtae]|nr:MICOS complex subunit MIC60 [Pontixanthobacter aquaemixtae]
MIAIFGLVLCALLLAGIVAGYQYWGGGSWGGDDAAEDTAAEITGAAAALELREGLLTQSGDAKEIVEQAEQATEAVERVVDKQGGLDQRLAAAEQRLDRLVLQAEAASGNAGRAEGLLIAFAARRTLEKGEPLGYLVDQLRLRFGAAQPDAVATIIDASSDPIRLDQLIAQLEGLKPKLVQADEGPSLERLRKEFSQLFVIRREGTASPRPDRTLDRARYALEAGRIRVAIEEVETMPGVKNAEGWIRQARRYAEIQDALDILEISAVKERSQLRDRAGRRIDQASPAEDTGN